MALQETRPNPENDGESSELPQAVNRILSALCSDYDRRHEVLCKMEARREVLQQYVEWNTAIDCALEEECEESIREEMRRDIGAGRGLAHSRIACLDERGYARRKLNVKLAIAKKIRLL